MRTLRFVGRGKLISACLSIGIQLDDRSWLASEPSILDELAVRKQGDADEEKEKKPLGRYSGEAVGLPVPTFPDWESSM
jgi:hypothetical protein